MQSLLDYTARPAYLPLAPSFSPPSGPVANKINFPDFFYLFIIIIPVYVVPSENVQGSKFQEIVTL